MLNVKSEVELINKLLSDYNAENGTSVSTEVIEEKCGECLIGFSDSGVGIHILLEDDEVNSYQALKRYQFFGTMEEPPFEDWDEVSSPTGNLKEAFDAIRDSIVEEYEEENSW